MEMTEVREEAAPILTFLHHHIQGLQVCPKWSEANTISEDLHPSNK